MKSTIPSRTFFLNCSNMGKFRFIYRIDDVYSVVTFLDINPFIGLRSGS